NRLWNHFRLPNKEGKRRNQERERHSPQMSRNASSATQRASSPHSHVADRSEHSGGSKKDEWKRGNAISRATVGEGFYRVPCVDWSNRERHNRRQQTKT